MANLLAHHWGPFKPGGDWGSTRVFVSQENPTALIVLVHGFLSKSKKTWPATDLMMLDDAAFRWADIVVWDYNSFSGNIPAEVVNLNRAIDKVWELNRAVFGQRLRRLHPEAFVEDVRYKRLIMIGYSLGGYVVRQTALNAATHHRPPSWLEELHIGLFAPAHCGASAIQWFRTDGGILDGFKQWARRSVARASDVLVPTSRFIKMLRARTEKAHAAGRTTLEARYIVYGENEEIVFVDKFDCDPVSIVRAPGRHHGDVQKANDKYQVPVNEIEALLP